MSCGFFFIFSSSFIFFWLGLCASTDVVDLIYFAGESALLDENGTRTASCTSLSDVEMLVLSRDDFMALSKHDQVSDMLVRAAELQRRSYGVKNDEVGSEEDDGEEEVVVEEDNGELGSGNESGGSKEKMSGGESDNDDGSDGDTTEEKEEEKKKKKKKKKKNKK